jgi:hypothetical protein
MNTVLEKIILELQKENIPSNLYVIFSKEQPSVLDVINTIKGNDRTICKPLNSNIENWVKVGEGGVNVVYDIGKGYVCRMTKNPVNYMNYQMLDTYSVVQDKTGVMSKVKTITMSDPLYDIVVNSIITKELKMYPNFNTLVGSFYCDSTQKMYSIMEKNDISLLSFIRYNFHLLSKNLLYSFVYQYAIVCYYLRYIGIVDFDRHLDNIMIKYVNSNYTNQINTENKAINPTPFSSMSGKDRFNTDEVVTYTIKDNAGNLRHISYRNKGLFIVPIDFGISIYETPNIRIYNEPKAYEVTHPECSTTYNAYENIKGKYAKINHEIQDNVMFFFFLKNLVKVLRSGLEYYKQTSVNQEVNTFIAEMNTIFCRCFGNDGSCRVNIMTEKGDDIALPLFYLYRNTGLPNVNMYDIITVIEKYYNGG